MLTDIFGAQFPYLFTSSLAMSALLFMLPLKTTLKSPLRMASFGFILVAASMIILTLTQDCCYLYVRGFALMLGLFGISCLFIELGNVVAASKLMVFATAIVASFGLLTFIFWLQSPPYFVRLVIIDTFFATSLGLLGFISQKLDRFQYPTSRFLLSLSAFSFASISLLRIMIFALFNEHQSLMVYFAYFYVSTGVFSIFGLGFGFALTHIERVKFEMKLKNDENIMLLKDVLEKKKQLEDVRNFITHEIVRPINSAKSLCRVIRTKTEQPYLGATTCLGENDNLMALERELDSAMSQIRAVRDFDDVESLLDDVSISEVEIQDFFSAIQSRWNVILELNDNTLGRRLTADGFLLDIAIDNIIENAFKFGNGVVRLSVCCDESSVCHVDVIDDGPGIPVYDWKNVWNIYFRVNSKLSSKVSGSGLGMFLVSKILSAHNGSAQVVSNSPSTIRISLPCQ